MEISSCTITSSGGVLAVFIILPLVFGIALMVGLNFLFERKLSHITLSKTYLLLIQSFVLIIIFGIISWGVFSYVHPCFSASIWLNGKEGVSFKTVVVGMGANVVFGFIDNAGLFFGGCYLDELFALLPGSDDANVVAGYGNTFSDLLGTFMGTFFGLILQDSLGIAEGPIWANAIGIALGCLLGIFIPKIILAGASAESGLNKITGTGVFFENVEIDELRAILGRKQTVLDYRALKAFNKMDINSDKTVTINEIKEYMQKEMGSDYDPTFLETEFQKYFNVDTDGNKDEFTFSEFYLARSLYNERKGLKSNEKINFEIGKLDNSENMRLKYLEDNEENNNKDINNVSFDKKITNKIYDNTSRNKVDDKVISGNVIVSEKEIKKEEDKEKEKPKIEESTVFGKVKNFFGNLF